MSRSTAIIAASANEPRTSAISARRRSTSPTRNTAPADGAPVFLMHGWPYDPRCYDEVVPPLVASGCRVIVPYLRGFGATRFLSPDTPRSGQQAALGNDLRELMDALSIARAVLAGYDWGGRAACIVAALWPRARAGLVTGNGYNIQNIPAANNRLRPSRSAVLVPVLFSHRTGARRARNQPSWLLPAVLGIVVAALGSSTTRRSRRAPCRSTIPISSRSRSSRTGIATATRRAIRRWSRSKSKLAAQPKIERADDHPARRRRRRAACRCVRTARCQFQRAASAAAAAEDRPQRAAGSAAKPLPTQFSRWHKQVAFR